MKISNYKKRLTLFVGVITMVASVNAQDGEAIFKQKCSVCHTIGSGKLVGPDLKDVTSRRSEEWIGKFINGSQKLVQSGDADAKAIFDEFKMIMPDQNLSEADLKAVVAYLAKSGGGEVAAKTTESKVAAADVASGKSDPASIIKGKMLFDGSLAFKAGGASCISCHNVNYEGMIAGGVLAKDLTDSYSRLGGSNGIGAILSSPPFPAMTSAFKNNPLSKEEIDAINAFLEDADKKNKEAKVEAGFNPLLPGGFAVFCGLFIVILLIWNKRKKQSVKKSYHGRQIESIN